MALKLQTANVLGPRPVLPAITARGHIVTPRPVSTSKQGKKMLETTFLENNAAMLESLKTIGVLEPFDDQELNKLLEMSKIRKFRAGECIMEEGQSDTWLYFLIYGQIQISKKGKEVAKLTRKGEIFGEMGAIDSSRRSASAHAITDVVCMATDIFYMEKLTGNDKLAFGFVFYRLMTEILSQRLRQTTEALIKAKGRVNLKFW
jgi:CRP/FNR family transcriptional regulator, cyclic AMP receptor protein